MSGKAFDQGSHAFLRTQLDGERPVGFDPCRPIGYVVHDTAAPAGALPLLHDAFAEISDATGLTFHYLGPGEMLQGGAYPAGGGDRTPVFVGWATPEAFPALAGDVIGTAENGGLVVNEAGDLEYEHGRVMFDAPDLTSILSYEDGKERVRATMMHELGHVVGLDHVDDTGEIMHRSDDGQVELGPGDRAGLAALGADRCEDP